VETTSRSRAHRLGESVIPEIEETIAEVSIHIEEAALRLHAKETLGCTATGTTRTIDHLAMTAAIEAEAEIEASEGTARHTTEDRLAER
jgi:hypothetical protein